MNNSILLKGSKDGLILYIEPYLHFEEIIELLKDKISTNQRFFKNARIALIIRGVKLTHQQELEIINTIESNSDMKIICIIDEDEVNNERFITAIREHEIIEQCKTGQIYKGNLKKGQVFQSKSTVIVIGNVEKGAKIYSGKDIIVIGRLNGYAHAGVDNDEACFIIALDINSDKIKIHDKFKRCNTYLKKLRKKGPEIAYIDNNTICIGLIENYRKAK